MKKIIAIALALMLCVGVMAISASAADTFTVYVEMDSAKAPMAWAWGGYGNAFAAWPGVAMEKDGDLWKIEVPMGTTGFIVNNGSGTQTSDITIPGDGDVTIKVSSDYKSFEVIGFVAPPSDGYYVTGSSPIFSDWTQKNEAGKMTEVDGIFVKEFKNVTPGNYSIKVNDGTWNNSWGGNGENGNYDFTVTEPNSTVTVKFNVNDKVVTVEINGVGNEPVNPPAPPVEFDAYYVAGSAALCNGKEWDAGAAENAMVKGEDGIWTITYTNIPAGEYELKVTAGNWDNNWGADGVAGGDNVKIVVEEAGDITVKFNPATNWISVYNGENPLTNDVSLAGIGLALLAATAGVVALVGKKKED